MTQSGSVVVLEFDSNIKSTIITKEQYNNEKLLFVKCDEENVYLVTHATIYRYKRQEKILEPYFQIPHGAAVTHFSTSMKKSVFCLNASSLYWFGGILHAEDERTDEYPTQMVTPFIGAVTHLVTSYFHVTAIDNSGTLRICFVDNVGTCWALGSNTYGALGTGKIGGHSNRFTKTLLNGHGVRCMSSRGLFTFVLYWNGEVWCYGHNKNNELGLGHNSTQAAPVKHDALSALPIIHLVTFMFGGFAITSNDLVYVWGNSTSSVISKVYTPLPFEPLCNKQISSLFVCYGFVAYSKLHDSCYRINEGVLELLPFKRVIHGDSMGTSLVALAIGDDFTMFDSSFSKFSKFCDIHILC